MYRGSELDHIILFLFRMSWRTPNFILQGMQRTLDCSNKSVLVIYKFFECKFIGKITKLRERTAYIIIWF